MIYVWGFLVSVLVVACEATFKVSASYWRVAWFAVPMALLINYLIYRLVHSAPSLVSAFVVFSATNIVMRTGVSLALGHRIGGGTWAAVGLLLLAAVVRHRWP